MKNIFQIQLILLMLLTSGYSYASTCVALGSGDVEAFVTKACSENSATGAIDLVFNGGTGPYDVKYFNSSNEIIQPENMNTLFPGNYRVEVTDANCSLATLQVNVGIADPITITATPAPICQASTGSISPEVTGGTEPYSFEWNNGEIDEELLGLEAGTYTVTVTDDGGCSAVESFVLIENESPITFAENFEMTAPTTCSSSDGWIKTWRPGNISGGMTPYAYLWSNGSTLNTIGPISAGTYTLTVTGADGCSAEKTQILNSLEQIQLEVLSINQPCQGAMNGNIFLAVNQPCEFTWSKEGANSIEIASELTNLAPGNYCVTISSIPNFCELEKCFVLNGLSANEPISITNITSFGTCAYSNDGSAEVNHIEGNAPFSYIWFNPVNEKIYNTKKIENLSAGTYYVTVSDRCGFTSNSQVEIESDEFSVQINVENGCFFGALFPVGNKIAYEGQVNGSINGLNSPFKILLFDKNNILIKQQTTYNNFTFEKLENSNFQLKVIDTKGCQFIKSFNIETAFVHFLHDEVNHPCKNMNNGSMTFHIFNPKEIDLACIKDGLEIYKTSLKEDEFIVSNLYGGRVEVNWVSSTGCKMISLKEKGYLLSEKPTEKQFHSYDKTTDLCHFNELCDGDILAIDSYLESSTLDFNNQSTFNCNIPRKCRDVKVDAEIDGKLKLIAGGHYVTLAESLKDQFPFYIDIFNIEANIDKVLEEGPCHLWFYCPVTLRIASNAWFMSPICNLLFGGNWNEDIIFQNGCVQLDCSCGPMPPGFPFCIENVIKDEDIPVLPGGSTTINLCFPKSMNLAQLILYENELKTKYPGYNSHTELYNFIHGEVLPSEDMRQKAVCSSIKFCLTDFRILSNNINSISCFYPTNYSVNPSFPKQYFISEKGGLEQYLPPPSTGGYYSTCVINQFGTGICSNGIEQIICPYEEPTFPPSPIIYCPRLFKDDDPVFAKSQIFCQDRIINIKYDSLNSEYKIFWEGVRDSNKIVFGERRTNNLNRKIHYEFFEYFSNDNVPLISISNDNKVFILEHLPSGNFKLSKINNQNEIEWALKINNFNVFDFSINKNGVCSLIGYDLDKQKWMNKFIDTEGNIENEKSLPLETIIYDKIHQFGNIIVAYNKIAGVLTIASEENVVNVSVPSGVNIKDIKTLENGNIIVAGDFKGEVSVAGTSYDSEGYKNAIFISYDKSGNLLDSKSVQKFRDETVNGLATKGNYELAYHGRYKEIVYYGVDSTINMIDSCIFIQIVPLADDICELAMPVLTLDSLECLLSLSLPHEDSMYINLQKDIEGTWTNISNLSSPFIPEENGFYRILINHESCEEKISDVVEVTCIVNEPCDEEPIDITYSQTENKFLYFYKKDGSGQIIKSEWVSPITYMMVDSFITWTCENIVIKDIIVDEQLYVYVIGHDITQTNRTRIIKYNWSTLQIVWSQWVETFIYQSLVPYAVNGNTQLAIAGFNTSNNLWYIKGYHKKTGVNVSQSVQDIKSAPGKLGWGFEWIRFFRENEFSFITVSPTSQAINFESPTNPYVAPLPPMIKVREITRLHNGFIVVGGDFSGTFTIDGVDYTSGPYRSIVFLEINNSGSVVNVKVFKGTKHHVLKTFTTDGYYKLAYAGYNTENVNIGEAILLNLDSLANHPDVCAVVDGGTLSSIQLRNAIKESPQSVVKFYPNPFSKGINLDIDSPQPDKVQITVRNSMGSVMFTTTKEVDTGQNIKYLDEFERLPAGVYLVHLKSSLMDHTTRVIRID